MSVDSKPQARGRGRPSGSSPTAEQDTRLLKQAVLQLVMGLDPDFTKAVRRILGDRKDAVATLRRLHRRWKVEHDDLLKAAREAQLNKLWEINEEELRKGAPRLHTIAKTFAKSAKGRAILRQNGIEPDRFMAAGIYRLWEMIQSASAIGADQADRFFAATFYEWASTGIEPDELFLKRFAKLTLAKAREIAERRAREPQSVEKESDN